MVDVSPLYSELIFKAVRSSGKGGQNVNKVSSKVELYFDVENSSILNAEQKLVLFQKLSKRISNEGVLMVDSQESRSQLGNRKIAIRKFEELIQKAFEKKKPRIKSKPSAAAKAKRLESKRKNAEKKQQRNKRFED